MKKTFSTLVFAFGLISVSAQAVWNMKLPMLSSRPFADARFVNGRYLLTAGGEVAELDSSGVVTGYADKKGQPSPLVFSSFIKTNPSPQSSGQLFLVCVRGIQINGPAAYSISMFEPTVGFTISLQLWDSLGSTSTYGPALVDIDDRTFWVLGRKAYRQITISDQSEAVLDWEKPLFLPGQSVFSAAVLKNGKVFAVTTSGILQAFGVSGDSLWTETNSFSFRGLAAASDGLIASGAANGNACLAKYNFNGDLIWVKTYTDLEYNSVCISPDGNIAATGKSVGNQIVLLKTDPNGNELWRHTYQPGLGTKVLPTPDGGFLVMASHQGRVYTVKTNGLGETSPPEERTLLRERHLNNGGISATQTPTSSLFFNGLESALLLPADSATAPIFVHSPWLAGKDLAEILYISASTYGEFFGSDYRNGILSSPVEDFNRLWSVTREDINRLRRDFGEDGDLDTHPPFDLLSWPAKGNPHFVQNLDFSTVTTEPDSLPAPFVDFNGDGMYNVYDGDYPRLKGDRMLWWAMTDDALHDESNSQPLGMDVLITLYAYDCPQNGSVSQSVFVEYQTINRSGKGYSDVFMGFHTDFDLGCDADDYIGSIPEANSYYVYNQDAIDGDVGGFCSSGVATYGNQVPVETVTLLNRSLDHSIYFNRGGTGGGNPEQSEATAPIEYYRYLQSYWRDGTPLTAEGSGFNPSNPAATVTNFAFSNSPNVLQGWTMCTANLPQGDRRMINSHGPFSFAAGDTFTMRLAFTFHPDIPHPCPDVNNFVKPTLLQIQQWHDEGTLDAHLDLGGVLSLAPGQSLMLNATQQDPAAAYAWSTGENTPSILVNQPGEYTVTVTPATGCAYAEKVLVKAASGTDNPVKPKWHLTPNPASNGLNILFVDPAAIPFTALLRNPQGQTVTTQNCLGNRIEIDLSSLPTGFYWVELWQAGRFWGSRKLVVAR